VWKIGWDFKDGTTGRCTPKLLAKNLSRPKVYDVEDGASLPKENVKILAASRLPR
jgi:hypothetical protein